MLSLLPGLVSPIFFITHRPPVLVTGLSYAFINLFCTLYLNTEFDQEQAYSGRGEVIGDVSRWVLVLQRNVTSATGSSLSSPCFALKQVFVGTWDAPRCQHRTCIAEAEQPLS